MSPTIEELKAFTVAYDGATRRDLVSRWMKLMIVVGDAKALDELKQILSPADLERVSGFQQRLVKDEKENDRVFAAMFQGLCNDIVALDGKQIARRALNIDQAVQSDVSRL